ncbi:unnamed protein product [Cladocopium goreaui]|uniref:Uncharacterized protein n=1 Tax=Cladocopium goreaui TaxID=2562237 RepID=A0A9P1DXH4_9DINO|nr:unnamed protein product [Cladocopium goreaui]
MDFDKEDRKLEEQIILAETALATAQEALDDAKKVATEEELKDQVETIEDEEEAVDRTVKTSQIMREGLSGMLDGLVQLKARTEDIGEEQGNKRQRTDDGLAKSSAMQPFGGDHVIAHLPIDLVFVKPQPPALQADGTVATVIVHQNPVPPRVPCLITAVLIDDPNTRILEMAHSVVPLLPPNDVLHLGGVADTCRQREQEGPDSCTLHVGFRLLPRNQAIIVEEGMGITIRVPSRLSSAEAEQNLVARVQQLRDNHPRHEWNDPEQERPEETHPAPAGLGTTAPQPEDVTSFMARSLHSSRSAADSDSDSSVSTHDMDATDESPSHIDAESFLTVIFSLDGQERQIDVLNAYFCNDNKMPHQSTSSDYVSLTLSTKLTPEDHNCELTADQNGCPAELTEHPSFYLLALVAFVPCHRAGRPELQFGDHLECLDALHRTWAVHSAIEREDEGRVLYISTWFPDAGRWPECDESRPVRLLQDFGQWADAIAEAWDDRLDPDCPVHLYLITPQPRSSLWMPENPVAHSKSIHIATLNPARGDQGNSGCIRIVPTQLWRAHILEAAGILQFCRPGHVDCMVWWGEFELRDGQQYQARHGFSFSIIRNNIADISASSGEHSALARVETDGPALLQTNLHLHKKKISLEELVPIVPPEATPMPFASLQVHLWLLCPLMWNVLLQALLVRFNLNSDIGATSAMFTSLEVMMLHFVYRKGGKRRQN